MIRTFIVDDEELARRGLRARLEAAGDIEIVGECATGEEAITAIRRLAPSLVFLDVQMPQLSGFDVIQAIRRDAMPYVIFLTAFDQYAVRAFEVQALDYLLKPIDDERLLAALTKVRGSLSNNREQMFGRQVAEAISNVRSLDEAGVIGLRGSPDRLAIPTGDSVLVLRASEIDWIEASGNYVSVHAGKKTWLLRETIASMDLRFAQSGFARIHRSTLVNLDRVVEVRTLGSGDYSLVLRDGVALKMSRSFRGSLERIIGDKWNW